VDEVLLGTPSLLRGSVEISEKSDSLTCALIQGVKVKFLFCAWSSS